MAKPSLSELAKSNRTKEATRFKAPSAAPALPPVVGVESRIEWWPVELCDDNPYQPRSNIDPDELEDLKASINKDGMRQIGEARLHPDIPGRVQLVFAHRRKYAILGGANAGAGEENPEQYRGLMPLRVYKTLTKSQMLRRAIDENEKRVDVSPLDRARAYLKLRDLVTEELLEKGETLGEESLELELEDGQAPDDGDGHGEIAVKKASWRTVARESGDEKKWRQMLRTAQLLELPADARDLLDKTLLNARQGRALVSMLKTPAAGKISDLAAEVARLRLSGEMAEKRAKKLIEDASPPETAPDLEKLADEASAEGKKKGAKKAKAANQLALDAGTSHLSLVPPASASTDVQTTPPTVAIPNGDSREKDAMAQWATALINARIQPAALSLDSARESFVLAKFGARERKRLLAAIEHLEEILEAAKKAL